jgi:hypothetical protein
MMPLLRSRIGRMSVLAKISGSANGGRVPEDRANIPPSAATTSTTSSHTPCV